MPISDDDKLVEAGRVLGQELLGTLLGTIDTAKEQLDKAGFTSKSKTKKASKAEDEGVELEEKQDDEEDDEEDDEDTDDDEDSEIDAAFAKKMAPYTKKMREEMKALFEDVHDEAHKATTKEFAALMAANNKVLVTAFAEAMNGLRKSTEKAARDRTLAQLKDIVAELNGGGKRRVKSRADDDEENDEELTEKEATAETALPLDDFFSFVGAGAPEAKIAKK